MSGRITKDMIDDETSKACRDAHFEAVRDAAGIGGDPEAELAAILNAAMQDPVIRSAFVAEAIVRGEASPPVWAFQYEENGLYALGPNDDSVGLFESAETAHCEYFSDISPGKAVHWKGNDTP